MSVISIITIIVAIVIITALIVLKYKIDKDELICCKCPYSNSLNCWECRRKYSINENKYNI